MFLGSRRTLLPAVCATVAVVSIGCSGPDGRPDDGGSSRAPTSPAPTSSSTATELPAPAGHRIGSTFFGMHDGRVSQGIPPDAPVGALRLWDTGTSWRQLETSPRHFDWSPLDTAVATAENAGARPLLVLGQTPTFYASRPGQEAAYGPGAASMPRIDAWRRYLTAVAKRFGDRIDYQVWNEANVVGYWAGTPRQMARLAMVASEIIREIVPEATVVSPPFVLRLPSQWSYFKSFWSLQSPALNLAAGLDAVALQLYPPADGLPEAEVRLVQKAWRVLSQHGIDLPLWNTEINYGLQGGPEPPPIPESLQRAFVMRTYLLNAGLGVQRVYWYRWDIGPIANTYLTRDDRTKTLAGDAFGVVRDWLDGARVQGCSSGETAPGVWACLASKGRQVRTFWWKPRGPATKIEADAATSWINADGTVSACRASCRVEVGVTPVMVVKE